MKTFEQKSGKVGHLVYSRNRFGFFCYQLVVPINPRTDKQVRVRNYLATVSAYWRLLTDLERLVWGLEGKQQRTRRRMGRRAPLTGFNYFMRVNLRRLNRGGTLVEQPPERQQGDPALRQPTTEVVTPQPQRSAAPVLAHHDGILNLLPRWWRGAASLLQALSA